MHRRCALVLLVLLAAGISCTGEKRVEKKQELSVTAPTEKAASVAKQTDQQSKKNLEVMEELEQPDATPPSQP